jgi:hypothetical protein
VADPKILIKILGDSKGAQQALGEVGGITEKLSGHMAALGASIGGALTVTAVTGFAKSSVDAFQELGGETRKLQMLMGGTAEDASRMVHEFEGVGLGSDVAANAIKKFSKAIEGGNDADTKAIDAIEKKNVALQANYDKLAAIKNPTDAQKASMAALREEMSANVDAMDSMNVNLNKYGIETKNLDGSQKSVNQLLAETADVFKNMPNGIEKNALAMKLFGKSGTDMLPFLNEGSDGMKKLSAESDKFGLTLTQKNLDALQKSKVASREWHAAIQGLQVQIGAYLQPALTAMAVFLAEHIPPAMELLRTKFAEAQPYIERFGRFLRDDVGPVLERFGRFLQSDVIPAVMRFAGTMRDDLAPIVARAAQIIRDDLIPAATTIFEYLSNHHGVLVAIGIAFAALLSPIGVLVGGLIYAYEHFQTFHDIVDGVMRAVRTVIEDVLGAIQRFWDEWGGTISRYVEGTFYAIRDTIQGVIDVIRGIIQTVMALIHGDWQGAWDGIKEILSGVWLILKGFVEQGIADIKLLFEGAVHILGDAWDLVWSKLKELAHAFFVDLPEYIGGKIADLGTFIIDHLWGALVAAWDATWDLAGKLHVFFADLPGKIADGVANIGTKIISGMWDALKAAWDLYWKLGEVINHGIASIMDDVITAAENIGSKIVDGIVRIIKAAPGALLDALKSIIPSAGDIVGSVVGSITGHLPGFASGGFPTGLSVVGENGPELVNFGGSGARVYSNPESRRMLSGGGGQGATVNVYLTVDSQQTGDRMTSHLESAQFARSMAVALRGVAA